MSVSVSQADGKKVITITSNPNSKWPILCQILANLCYSPKCAVSPPLKTKMMGIYTSLGIMQIIVGIVHVMTGIVYLYFGIHNLIMVNNAPFWLGGVCVVIGIVSIVATRVPNYFLTLAAVVLNKVSAVLAMIGLALYAWDLVTFYSLYVLDNGNMVSIQAIRTALDINMMIFSALQLCVTLSFSVLTLNEMCSKDEKFVEDPELYKPLKEEISVSHVC